MNKQCIEKHNSLKMISLEEAPSEAIPQTTFSKRCQAVLIRNFLFL